MIWKKKKKAPQNAPDQAEQVTQTSEEAMRRRFGAKAYVENIEPEDENEVVLSLDSLREAFAALDGEEEKLGRVVPAMVPETDLPEPEKEQPIYEEELDSDEEPTDRESVVVDLPESDGEKAIELSPITILEAMLFVGDRENRPLAPQRAVEKMRNVTTEEIDQAVIRLNSKYERLGCPYTIRSEPEGYRMVLRPEFEPIQSKFYGKIREARLSQQAIDTLAVVAYRQPITAEEVQKIRKQPSTSLLAQLVRRGLLEMEKEIQGKKKIVRYRTTDRFLELFQLDTIDDLPVSDDLGFR